MGARSTAIHIVALAVILAINTVAPAQADDKAMIDANTDRALSWLRDNGNGVDELLEQAAGVLVFPDVVRMGFGVGGEFGEGSLLVDGETVDYYATAGKTFGLEPDTQFKAEVIFFMTEDALRDFRERRGWKVGVHGAVPLVSTGAGGQLDASQVNDPMVGLIFSEDGLVQGLALEGNRFTKIAR
jgi:lipid-binding SYLF domain-containing protein